MQSWFNLRRPWSRSRQLAHDRAATRLATRGVADPAFGRYEELTGQRFRVEYSDDDPSSLPREVSISQEEFERLPEDGAAGFGFIEGG